MFRHSTYLYIFFCFILLSCKSESRKKESAPLLTMWYSENGYGPFEIKFTQENTVDFKNTKPYLDDSRHHSLSEIEIVKRDSFIQLMTINNKKESYVDMDNCFESHEYRITLNTIKPNKEIRIIGHNAPQNYFDFVLWTKSLTLKP